MPKEIVLNVRADTKDAEKNVDDLSQSTGILGQKFQQLKGGLTSALGGVKTLITGFKSLRFAIASTGIGLLIIALGSLAVFFTSTKRGADSLAQTMAGLGAGIDVVTDRISAFGEGIIKIISGDFDVGIDKITNSFKGLGDEISREVEAAERLEESLQRLEDREISFIAVRAEGKKVIAELRASIEDENLSIEKRIGFVDQAIKIQRLLSNEEVKQAKEKARIVEEKIALGESSRDDERELEELRAKVFEKETQRFTIERSLIARRRGLRKESEAEEGRIIADRNKREQEVQKAREERQKKAEAEDKRLTDEKKKRDDKELKEKIKREKEEQIAKEKQAKEEIELEKNLSRLKDELRLTDTEKQIQLVLEEKERRFETIRVTGEEETLLREEIEQDAQFRISQIIDNTREEQRQRNLDGITETAEFAQQGLDFLQGISNEKIKQSQNEFIFNNQKLNLESKNETAALNKRIKDENIGEIGAQKLREELNIKQIKSQNKLINERNKQLKKEFETNKKLAIASVIINGAIAIVKGFSQLGPIGGAISAIAIGILGAVQIDTINKQKFTGGAQTIPVPEKTDFTALQPPTEPTIPTIPTLPTIPGIVPSGISPVSSAGVPDIDTEGLLCPSCPDFPTEGDEVFGTGAGQRQQIIQAVVSEKDITDTQLRLKKFEERSEIG